MEFEKARHKRKEDEQGEELTINGGKKENQESYKDPSKVNPSAVQERYITLDQFNEVVKYAHILEQAEIAKDRQFPQGLEIAVQNPSHVSMTEVNNVIDTLMPTGKPYMHRALDILLPSYEQIKTDLENVGSSPSSEVVFKTFCQKLEAEIKRKTPGIPIKFKIMALDRDFNSDLCSWQIDVEGFEGYGVGKGFYSWVKNLFSTRKRNHEYASIILTPAYSIKYTFKDPVFLRLAGAKLEELNKWFLKVRPQSKIFSTHTYQTE